MAHNSYDGDVTIWSPQGKLFQVEYACEATKHGSCCVGIRTNEFVVLVSIKKDASELAEYNDKIYELADNIGTTFTGITSDANYLTRKMRTMVRNHEYLYNEKTPLEHLLHNIALFCQKNTIESSCRPFGVSMLIAGYDNRGPHLYETSPYGFYEEYSAYALGSRCQAARTYLEKHFKEFDNCELKQAQIYALKALQASIKETELQSAKNRVEMAIVGKNIKFTKIPGNDLQELYATALEFI